MFQMPKYREPDFTQKKFAEAPDAVWETVSIKGVAPEQYHSTSMYPEYFKVRGRMEAGKRKPHGFQRSPGRGWRTAGGGEPESGDRR